MSGEEGTPPVDAEPAVGVDEVPVEAEAKAPEPSPLSGNEPPAATPETPSDAPDWRTEWSGGDEKLKALLDRYSDPGAAMKALHEARTKLSQRDEIDWNDEAGTRKKLGIPEKIDDYTIKPVREDMNDGEKAAFDGFREMAHKTGIPQKYAQAAIDYYFDIAARDEQSMQEHISQTRQQNLNSIKEKYGHDYNRNFEVAKTFLDKHAGGADGRKSLADMRLMDGTPLGDHPAFLEFVVSAGLATLDDGEIITPMDGGGGKSLEENFREMMGVKYTDPQRYQSKEFQDRLKSTADLIQRRQSNGGRR